MMNFYEIFHAECGVRLPWKGEQDWEFCAGDHRRTADYIRFYHAHADEMTEWEKHLTVHMIVQGVEDAMENHSDKAEIDLLWEKTKEILLTDQHRAVIVYWSCIGEESEDCWNITQKMRELL